MKTLLGYTRAKRQLKRELGISQVQAWTKPSRVKQRFKYKLGWYSPVKRVARNNAKGKYPSFLGLFSLKE
jgi:isopentenyldiphosphate isomerase